MRGKKLQIGTSVAARWLTSSFQSRRHGIDLWSGTKIPHACAVRQEKKKKKKLKKVKRLYIETSLSRNSRERNEIVAEGERVLGKGFFISLRRKK